MTCCLLLYRFDELANKAQSVDTINNVEFVMLDCSPLKFAIVSHIDELVTRLQNLLLEMASTKLSDICDFMSVNAKK